MGINPSRNSILIFLSCCLSFFLLSCSYSVYLTMMTTKDNNVNTRSLLQELLTFEVAAGTTLVLNHGLVLVDLAGAVVQYLRTFVNSVMNQLQFLQHCHLHMIYHRVEILKTEDFELGSPIWKVNTRSLIMSCHYQKVSRSIATLRSLWSWNHSKQFIFRQEFLQK